MPTIEGPPLPILLQRLAQTPAEFFACAHVGALVNDVLSNWEGEATPQQLMVFNAAPNTPENDLHRNRLHIVSIGCWLLRDGWFEEHAHNSSGQSALQWLSNGLDDLSVLIPAAQIVNDADRREEFARRALLNLGFHPHGESETQARDRLKTLDSVERQQVILKTRKSQERARQIREEMARKAAEEAASRYGRE